MRASPANLAAVNDNETGLLIVHLILRTPFPLGHAFDQAGRPWPSIRTTNETASGFIYYFFFFFAAASSISEDIGATPTKKKLEDALAKINDQNDEIRDLQTKLFEKKVSKDRNLKSPVLVSTNICSGWSRPGLF